MHLIRKRGSPPHHRGERSPLQLKLPARASLVGTVTGVACRLTSFLLTPVFTRIMSKSALGEYSLFTTFLGIISAVGSLELSGGVLFSLLSENREREREITRIALLTVASLTALVSLPASYFYYRDSGVKSLLLPLALIISSISRVTLLLYSGRSRYRYKYRIVSLLSLTEALLPPAITLIFFSRTGSESLGTVRCISLCAVLFALALPCAIGLLGRIKDREPPYPYAPLRKSEAKERIANALYCFKTIMARALPTLPYFLSVSLISSLDKVIIASRLGEVALGEYSVAHALGSGISMLTSGIGVALTPWIIRKYKSEKYGEISRLIGILAKAVPLFALLLLTVAPELFKILAPSEYQEALGVVYAVALGALPLFLTGCVYAMIICTKKVRLASILALIPTALSLLLNLTLIDRGGIIVSGITLAFSYTALYLILSYSLKKINGKSLINENCCLQITLFCAIVSSLLYLARGVFLARAIAAIILVMLLLPSLCQIIKLVREK